jgi:hypothetical protein
MIHPIAKDIWGIEEDLKLPGGLLLPTRSTVLRLEDGRLILHSPLAIDDSRKREIDALGEVAFLVAPSCIHWMFLRRAAEHYPKARVLGAPGLEKKVRGGLRIEPLPESGRIADVGDQLRVERIQGVPYMTEHVFLHEASRSLVVTDLMFNVHATRSFGMQLFLRLMGAWKKTAQSRAWRFLMRDRAAAARSAMAVLSWDFERVVVGHGDVVEENARTRAQDALTWMTSGSPPLLGTGSVVA